MPKIVTTINGHFVKDADARVSVYDNALLYGEGLFETFLAIDDRPAFTKEHLQRLHKGARYLGLKVPVSDRTITEWLIKTAGKHPARFKRLRLTMTSGESPVWRDKPGEPQVICSAVEHKFSDASLKLFAPTDRVDNLSLFNRVKTVSYGSRAAALRQARRNGCDDALLINNQGEISELTSANIFWVQKRIIYTPPLAAGCLEGVTRRVIMEQAHRMKWKIVERNCTLEKLIKAEEVFSTSSVRLAQPVGEIKAAGFKARFQSGEMCRKIYSHIRQMLDIY